METMGKITTLKVLKVFLVIQSLLIALVSFGAARPENKSRKLASNFACVQRIYSVLDRWEAPEGWEVKAEGSIFEIESKTNSKDVILYLRHSADFSEITRSTPSEKRTLKFEAPSCNLRLSIAANSYKRNRAVFTDHELAALLDRSQENGAKGLIYVWSPNMILSVRGVAEAANLAKNMKLGFVPLLDPYADGRAAEQAVQMQGLPREFLVRLESSELMSQDALTHYPALYLFSNGALLNTTRLGYDASKRLRTYIEDNLK